MKTATTRSAIVGGAAAYLALFHLAYSEIISPIYSYEGFVDVPTSLWSLLTAAGVALLPAFWIPNEVRRPSQVVYWLLYLLVIIPAAVVPFRANAADQSDFFVFLCSMVGAFALLGRIYSLPLMRITIPRFAPRTFWVLVAFASIASFSTLLAVTGTDFRLVSLDDIYAVRSVFKETLARQGTFFAYLVIWQSYVLFPLFMSFGLIKKNVLLFVLGVLGEAVVYSITGFKSALFSGLLFFILLAALRGNGRSFGLNAVWGMVSGLIVLLVGYTAMNKYVVAIFLQRTLALPAMLTAYYFDFFSHNPKALLGHSILKPIFHYPYDIDISYLIGRTYFGRADTSANANIWADAFGNFGYFGVFSFTVVLAIILWLFDCASEGMDKRLVALMLGIPAFSLSNSGLLTCLLSHGIGFALIVVYVLPRDSRAHHFVPEAQQP